MNRRSLLLGAIALSLTQLGARCGSQNAWSIRVLKNSVPAQFLGKFRQRLKGNLPIEIKPLSQLRELFTLLQQLHQQSRLKNQPSPSDHPHLVMLGDYWLKPAIQQKLIQPISPQILPNHWSELPRKWQELVIRNESGELDPQGKIWGVPYRWGTTMIVYQVKAFKRLGWTPQDWSDLWRSELKNRISLLDNSREVIGLTLKKLGKSYNTENLEKVPQLSAELQALQNQVKFYSSDHYLQPLILEDTWLAVGWSTDILPLLKKREDLGGVIPLSGTALWTDIWVEPHQTSDNNLTKSWLDFCWESPIAIQLSLLTQTSSPILVNTSPESLPQVLRHHPFLSPSPEILAKSEFLLPLSTESRKQYRHFWELMRNQKL